MSFRKMLACFPPTNTYPHPPNTHQAVFNGRICQCTDAELTTLQGSEEMDGRELTLKPTEGGKLALGQPSSVVRITHSSTGNEVVLSERATGLLTGERVSLPSAANRSRL